MEYLDDFLKLKRVFKFIDIYIYKHYFQSNTSINVYLSLVLIFPHPSTEKECTDAMSINFNQR